MLKNTTNEDTTTSNNNELEDLSFNNFDLKETVPIPKIKKSRTKKSTKKNNDININLKQKLIFKILKYQDNNRFGPILKKLNIKYNYSQLNSKNIDILTEILHRIYVNIDNYGMDKFYDMMVHQTSNTFEKCITPFYNIDGFSDSLLCDETFLNLIERYKIEHTLPEVPIGVQISLCITKHMLLCNQKNKLNKNNRKININKNYKIPDIILDKNTEKLINNKKK